MDVNQIISELSTIGSLYSEVLLCILAAGILGFFVGFMVRRSRSRQVLAKATKQWRSRYESLEESTRIDAENLEEQLQSLARDHKSLQANNRALADSMKKSDTNTQKGRAEYIELNREHTETIERLHRTIEQKDREFAELGDRLDLEFKAAGKALSTSIKTPASVTRLTPDIAESDLNSADTIALTSAHPIDTTKISLANSSSKTKRTKNAQESATDDLDDTLDDTSDLSEFSLEESTVAMDEDALAFAQKTFKTQRGD